MNVLFDMETGDPDDLITLLLLLNNSKVKLRGITCYQGSPIQIGLINHVLKLAGKDGIIPVGGWNSEMPSELSDYYSNTVGKWEKQNAEHTPVEVFKSVFFQYPDTHVLTGAPLTNIGIVLDELKDIVITNMNSQGGYLGDVVPMELQLSKFKGRKAFRTYNLGSDVEAFDKVNNSRNIESLTYITKDLCHGFMYTPEIHKSISFASHPIGKLLQKCLAKYADMGKSKAMHDPLAMLLMLYPALGKTTPIHMSYRVDEREHPVFSSLHSSGHTYGLINYDKDLAWSNFKTMCESSIEINHKNKI